MGLFDFSKKLMNPAKGLNNFLMGKDYSGKQKNDINSVLGPLKGEIGMSKAASKAALMKSLSAIQGGFGSAKSALAKQGALGTKAILDREQQAHGGATQGAINSGLWGTTAGASMQRGVTADTNQSLAELNSMLAQIGSNIDISEGQALAGAYGDLASVDQNYAQLMASLGLGQLGATQNVQYGKQGGALNDIFKLGATAIGASSDRRLKKNVEHVGFANGHKVYEFEYIDGDLPGRWRGVMADEVESVVGAVSYDERGYARVNYDALGFHMTRVS